MANYSNVEINIFSLAVLLVIYRNMKRSKGSKLPDQQFFTIMIFTTAALLIFDAVQWLSDAKTDSSVRYANLVADMLYYMLQAIPCICCCFYIRFKKSMNMKETMKVAPALIIPAAINFVLAVLSCFYNIYFYIDENNVYHRGELFWVFIFLISVYFIYAIAYTFINKKNFEKEVFNSLVLFMIPPVLGTVVQTMYYGLSLIWPCVTMSLLIIYINIQSSQLYTDHLTGLSNRRLLDAYLDKYMSNSQREISIGAIMLDIDNFKQINDKFGHTIGDQALVTTAVVLKRSLDRGCLLARYGGDEFVIVRYATNLCEIGQIVENIENNLEIYNRKASTQFSINLTAGYGIFECGVGLTKNDVLNEIDKLMYENKHNKLQ